VVLDMSFEVYPVSGACQNTEIDPSRSTEEVARDIKEVYEEVGARSGRIVAEHNVRTNHFSAPGEPIDCLYVVAEYKDSKFVRTLKQIDEFMSR
jgi:hypothetical protein